MYRKRGEQENWWLTATTTWCLAILSYEWCSNWCYDLTWFRSMTLWSMFIERRKCGRRRTEIVILSMEIMICRGGLDHDICFPTSQFTFHVLFFAHFTCNTNILCDKLRVVLILTCLWYNEIDRHPRACIAEVELLAYLYRGYTTTDHSSPSLEYTVLRLRISIRLNPYLTLRH